MSQSQSGGNQRCQHEDINGEWITPDLSDGEWVSVDTSVSSVIVTTEDAIYRLNLDGRPELWKIP